MSACMKYTDLTNFCLVDMQNFGIKMFGKTFPPI